MQQRLNPILMRSTGRCPAVPRSNHARGGGFTLLELLVVVAILVLLASLVTPSVMDQLRRNHVAQAAESVREVISRSRTLALDAGIDYQFRYEPNGRQFVVLPLELEPSDSNSADGEARTAGYIRLAGELDEGLLLQPSGDSESTSESLFRFDGTADNATLQVANEEKLTAELSVRGLTGGIAVSRVYREAD